MSFTLRLLCVVGAICVFLVVSRSIRRSKLRMEDSIFWVALTACMLVLAIFPRIASFFAGVLGFQSPSNMVFLFAIGILLIKLFSLSSEVSLLKNRLNELAQEDALREKEQRDE